MSALPEKILLAVDGSRESDLALQYAVGISDKLGSELHVVHVGTAPTAYGATEAMVIDPDAGRHLYEMAKTDGDKVLEEQVRKAEAAGKKKISDAYLRIGRPDAEIVSVAEEIGAGMIVLGSRGFNPLKRAAMGSVSDSVVRHAHCPVLVVRG